MQYVQIVTAFPRPIYVPHVPSFHEWRGPLRRRERGHQEWPASSPPSTQSVTGPVDSWLPRCHSDSSPSFPSCPGAFANLSSSVTIAHGPACGWGFHMYLLNDWISWLKPYWMVAGRTSGCKIEIPRTACVAKSRKFFWRMVSRGPAEWFWIGRSSRCNWTFWNGKSLPPALISPRRLFSQSMPVIKIQVRASLPHWDL